MPHSTATSPAKDPIRQRTSPVLAAPSASRTLGAAAAPRGHNSVANDLKAIFKEGRPLVERWLDISEKFAALRDDATAHGIDWSQVKALLKAQVQDERAGESRRVTRIVEKADYASAYAKLLGLGSELNEKKYS